MVVVVISWPRSKRPRDRAGEVNWTRKFKFDRYWEEIISFKCLITSIGVLNRFSNILPDDRKAIRVDASFRWSTG